MPLKLKPPRIGHSPFWRVRGKLLGVRVNRSTGLTEKGLAKVVRDTWEREIVTGQYRAPGATEPVNAKPTFLRAAKAYINAGFEMDFLGPIIEQTGEHALRDRLIEDIDQVAIDNAANALYPNASAPTKNRNFYTPVSAVLKRAGAKFSIKRPKGWRGKKSTSWLEPEQAFRLFEEADKIEPEFGLFCRFLLYTGERLGEALRAELRHLQLHRSFLYLPDSKNGLPRPIFLPPDLVMAFRLQPPRRVHAHSVTGRRWIKGEGGRGPEDGGVPFLERRPDRYIFRFTDSGATRDKLKLAMTRAGLKFPRREGGFHIFCHTYGTWMRRFGGLTDALALCRTGRWVDPESADRYVHTEVSEEARRSELFPTPNGAVGVPSKLKVV